MHRRTVRQALTAAMPPPRKAYPGRTQPAIDPWVEIIAREERHALLEQSVRPRWACKGVDTLMEVRTDQDLW